MTTMTKSPATESIWDDVQVSETVESDELIDLVDTVKKSRMAIFATIKPDWNHEDKQAVDQIKRHAGQMVNQAFGEVFDIVDALYLQARVPALDHNGSVIRVNDRVIWDRDDEGAVIEDWDRVSERDIDRSLMKLQQLKFNVAAKVNELFMEAYLAKNLHKDEWLAAYEGPKSGTATIRDAVANRQTLDSKYNSIFRYWMYSSASTFQKEMEALVVLLGRLRSWRINDRKQ